MLTHHFKNPKHPERVVIVGAGGFVGGAVDRRFRKEGIYVLPLARQQIDLLDPSATEKLKSILQPQDTVILISAMAPVKNGEMLEANIRMMNHILPAIQATSPAHVIYISSDAIYSDSKQPLNEDSTAEPSSLHGIMHLARELMLRTGYKGRLALIRPTLIFGPSDPHNGYGPNKFSRLALKNEEIVLFGEGEELRDHVYVEDVAEIIFMTAIHQSVGILNAVSGRILSFREVATHVIHALNSSSKIRGTPRAGGMPHNGYRAFDISQIGEAFPGFKPTRFEVAVKTLDHILPTKR